MLLLVLAGNFFFLIVGWAFVGAASYLLITFWYRRDDGDAGGHQGVRHQRRRRRRPGARHVLHLQARRARSTSSARSRRRTSSRRNDGDLVAGCLLLLVGAFAKSAQVPLHTWLPDAMEGPTPVSALIHAATMVTAGVYLIARMHPFFEQAPTAADVGAIIGCVTLLIAATIALVVTDLKRVIAYSTMSQIGYMIMGVSLVRLRRRPVPPDDARVLQGAALHGRRLGDRRDGGRAEPRQDGRLQAARCRSRSAAWSIGGLALSGVPPFAGFFSKDEILAQLLARDDWHIVLAVLGYVGAFMTAIYTWRMIFRAFYGEPVEPARELEDGHLYHAPEHTNPATGEVEDTDVGFPGPDHHIAEREWQHEDRDGRAGASARSSAACCRSRASRTCCTTFLEPTFHDSAYYEELEPSDGADAGAASLVGAVLGARRHLPRLHALGERPPSARASIALRERFGGLHTLLRRTSGTSTSSIDAVVVRPFAMLRALRARRVRARRRSTASSSAGRRASCARARPRCARSSPASCATTPRCCSSASTGARPLLPDRGLVTIHLSILLFFPLVLATLGALRAARARAGSGCWSARSCRSPTRCCCCSTSTRASAGLQYVTDDKWIPDARRSATRSASTG